MILYELSKFTKQQNVIIMIKIKVLTMQPTGDTQEECQIRGKAPT